MLRGARDAGLLELLAAATTSGVLSERLGVPVSRLEAALGLLEAHGIVNHEAETWCLSTVWGPLALGRSSAPFDGTLAMGVVRARQFERCLEGSDDYWALDADDRRAVALGISSNPALAADIVRSDIEELDGVVDALREGGRVLELGCGVGSRITALMLAFPAASAVGVELAEDLVAYGRERASQLGVADRVAFVVGDATTYDPDGRFDLVGWSQFFFPERTRPAALKTARQALRPGGWVTAPAVSDGIAVEPESSAHRTLAAHRLMLDIWDVPLKPTGAVADEMAAAGFVDLRIDRSLAGWLVRGRRP